MRRFLLAVAVALVLTAPGGLDARAAPTQSPPTVGAYYYPWYGPARRHWQDGYLRNSLSVRQPPLLGEYNSRDPNTVASHLQWAQQYGIDILINSWWGASSYEDVTIKDHLLTSPAIGPTRVAIFYESISLLGLRNGVIQFDSAVEQKLISDFDYLARTYFSNSHYQRIDGKPVVYLYVTRIYRGEYERALANLRTYVRNTYGYDLYLVGDEVDWDGAPDRNRIRLFDAITPYTMYSDLQPPGWPDDTGFLAGVQQRYDSFKNVAAAEGVRFIPGVLPAFNDRGVRLAASHYVLPHEVNPSFSDRYSLFSEFLAVARDSIDPAANMMTVTSWNEWHEDSQIEPTAPAGSSSTPAQYTTGYTYHSYGFKLLEILRDFKDSFYDAAGYARPTAASPIALRLVPSFDPCTGGNARHAGPLTNSSCSAPVQASSFLTFNAPERPAPYRGTATGSGSLVLNVFCTDGAAPPCTAQSADQQDIEIKTQISDVRCISAQGGCPAAGSAFSGKLLGRVEVRITDRLNGLAQDTSATVTDYPLQWGLQCSGGACSSTTSADAVIPGMIKEQKRAIWELEEIEVLDGGPDGALVSAPSPGSGACPPACRGNGGETVFLRQGIFAP